MGIRGRPGAGADHAWSVPASSLTQARLHGVLQTLTGDATVQEVADRLGVSREWMRQQRQRALAGAAQALEPGRPGRPPGSVAAEVATDGTAAAQRIAELEGALADAQVEIEGLRLRTEIALVMPHLLKKTPDVPTLPRSRRERRKAQRHSHRETKRSTD